MKRRIQIYCLIGLIGLTPSVHTAAQKASSYSRAKVDSLLNPPLLEGGERILHFDTYRQYLDTLSEYDSPRTSQFVFRNTSGGDIRITRIYTTCGCTGATFNKSPLAPNAESVISLTYDPKNRPGTIDTRAFVYTTVSDSRPVAHLTLLGYVSNPDPWRHLPHSIGTLRVKRKQVEFSELTPSAQPSARILCGNAGSKALQLTATELPPYASFHTEPAVIEPGQEGDLVITVDAQKLPKDKKPHPFSFAIEGVDAQPADRSISVSIKCTQSFFLN